ncbi:hypothetical protein OC861_002402 [Tilletia horrida]|nr:hypothetical protein OC861_002402 [Tilletia horrida]
MRVLTLVVTASLALLQSTATQAGPVLDRRQGGSSTSATVPLLTAITPSLSAPTPTASSSSASSTTQTASSTTSSSASQQTLGFVNNGTVGTYPCALPPGLAVNFGGAIPGGVDPSPGPALNVSLPDGGSNTTMMLPTGPILPTTSTTASTSVTTTGTALATPSATQPYANNTNGIGGSAQQVVYSVDTGFSSGLDCSAALPAVYPYNSIHLRAPDDSIRATFLPYAATLSELWVKDRYGQWRDIVLGFDNKTNYGTDTIHPNFSPVVGRYANRIKNGTFAINGTQYNTTLNENGLDTLHGGNPGYDRSSFSVADVNATSVTFKLVDPAGNQGFPNEVQSQIQYTLSEGGVWKIQMNASASGPTPIMLSSHVYWQLEGYNATEGQTILDHYFHLPKADKVIATDSILIPTGQINNVSGTAFDFQEAKTFRSLFNETEGVCGAGCQGWDTCFVMSEHNRTDPVIELWSTKSGIKLQVTTDQVAFQVYTCDGLSSPTKGSLPRKLAHGGDGTLNQIYENHSCVVLEAQDYIDAVNNPQWGRDPIYTPDRPYEWQVEYTFSTIE